MSAVGSGEMKVSLHQLLKTMIEKGASDLHITTGSAPLLRIDGSVVPLKLPPLSPIETKQLCYSVLTEEQKVHFEKNNELDLSFGVKNLSRFRANIFTQRGAVSGAFRAIPFKISSFEEIHDHIGVTLRRFAGIGNVHNMRIVNPIGRTSFANKPLL